MGVGRAMGRSGSGDRVGVGEGMGAKGMSASAIMGFEYSTRFGGGWCSGSGDG